MENFGPTAKDYGIARGNFPFFTGNENVLTWQQGAEDLNDTFRPFYTPDRSYTDIWVDSNTGSDETGDGQETNPFASIERAVQMFGASNVGGNILLDGMGTYEFPTVMTQNSRFNIVGVPYVDETITSYTVDSISQAEGVVITITRTPTLANNEWQGKILQGTWGGQTRAINIAKNVGNTIYGVVTGIEFLNSEQITPSGDLDLLIQPEVNIPSSVTPYSNQLISFRQCKITGGAIFLSISGRLDFFFCELNNQRFSSLTSRSLILGSTISMTGIDRGIIQVNNSAVVRLGQGTVITDKNISSADRNFVQVSTGGKLEFTAGVHVQGFKGFRANNGVISANDSGNSNSLENYFYDDCEFGYILNDQLPAGTFAAPRDIGGEYFLPKSTGEITGDYYVQAERSAVALIESGTDVTTATGTNTVSADGGTGNVCIAADGTRIYGGTPDIPAFKDGGSLFTSTTEVGNVGSGEDDLISYTMPANTLYTDGDRVEIVAAGTAQSTQTVKLYLGTTAILTHNFSGGGAKDWKITANIIKSGTGAQKAIVNLIDGGGSNVETEYTDVSEDETTDLDIKCTGQGTSNDDIVQELMTVNWFANP